MMDFIERLRAKPEHVRHRIALGASAGATGLVAIAWFGALATSNAFTISPSVPGDVELAAALNETSQSANSLMGAAGFLNASARNEDGISVVDTQASSTIETPTTDERTVIPF